ncbi:MAG TPA: ABC transporter permease [Myxococcales bacterium]|nr:ABC transporter permease [Myxococcales bacterium]
MDELRSAFRRLKRQPLYSLLVILVLGLGIGGTTAIFSVVEGVLLRPLPYPAPERLMLLNEHQPNVPNASISIPDFKDLRDKAKSFEAASSYLGRSVNVSGLAVPERLGALQTDGAYFDALRPRFAEGRPYTRGGTHQVVLSAKVARRLFPGGAQGKTMTLDGEPYVIAGVLQRDAGWPLWAEIWMLQEDQPPVWPGGTQERGDHFLRALLRLRAGVTGQQARAELSTLSTQLEEAFPATNRGHRLDVVPLEQELLGGVRASLWMLFAAVFAVLLVSCVNVANLQLGRAVSRRRELATRIALGASRARLLRHMLAETVVLALPGAAIGILLAYLGGEALAAAQHLPRAEGIGIDLPVLLFALLAAALAGVGSGLAPALLASQANQIDALRDSMPSGRHRLRTALVVVEVALTCALLASAALLGRSFGKLASVDPGFDPAHAVTLRVTRPAGAEFKSFFPELMRRAQALPGVKAAGAILNAPLGGNNRNGSIIVDGSAPPVPNDQISEFQVVLGDYFGAMGMKLKDGRFLREAEPAPVLLVNEAFAKKYFPGARAVGHRVRHDGDDTDSEIVGVVNDVHQQSLATPPQPEWYEPFQFAPQRAMSLMVRGDGPLAKEVAAEVALLDPAQPVYAVQPLEAVLSGALAQRRAALSLLGIFSAVALVLSVLGLYGVIALSVEQRRREIGVRMALGANAGSVVWLVIGQGMRAAAMGVAAGALLALALSPLMRSLLYGVGAIDPASLLTSAGVLCGSALLACWLPARRASRVDPVIALKAE